MSIHSSPRTKLQSPGWHCDSIFYYRCVSQIRQMFVQSRWHGRRYVHQSNVSNPIKTFKRIFLEDREDWLNKNRNRDAFVRYVVENPLEINRNDLSAVPFDVLVQIVGHPAFVIEDDPVQNELACLELFKNQLFRSSRPKRHEWIPQILRAVHLPVIAKEYDLSYNKSKKSNTGAPALDLILRHSHNIPKLDELFWLAINENKSAHETLEWYLERFSNTALLCYDATNGVCDFVLAPRIL